MSDAPVPYSLPPAFCVSPPSPPIRLGCLTDAGFHLVHPCDVLNPSLFPSDPLGRFFCEGGSDSPPSWAALGSEVIDNPSFHEGIVFSGLKTVRRGRAWRYTLGGLRQVECEARATS